MYGNGIHLTDLWKNRLATILPNGRRIDTQRYGSGHWIGTLWNGTPLVDLERDDLHRETLRHLGTGKERLTQTRAYNPLSRLTRLRLTGAQRELLAGRSHSYDPVGNLTAICQGAPNFPQMWELKFPHPAHASVSSGLTRPAFNFSFKRYELPLTFNVRRSIIESPFVRTRSLGTPCNSSN